MTAPAAGAKGRRVLIILENLPLPFDRRCWQQALALRDAGYRVSVICPKGKGFDKSYERLEGIHIHRHPLPIEAARAREYPLEYGAALFWETLLAWKIFFTRGFDVIQAGNPPDDIFLVAAPFKYLLGRKYLFDHRDVGPELFEAKFGRKGLLYRLVRWLERMTYRVADVAIVTNESYRRVAIERGRMDPAKVFVVRSGPSLDRMRILPPVSALKRGRRYLVGYVGVMGAQDGLDYVLRAAQHIVHERGRTDVQFGLVGGGSELESLKRLADELGVADHVTFTGRVSDQALLEMLNTADVCVNSDEHNAMNDMSTMNKIMEYMALAKPLVQFDLTEGRVSAGEASLYARPNDAIDMAEKILELLDDPARREAMGRLGRQRVENELAYSYEIPKLLAAYEALWTP